MVNNEKLLWLLIICIGFIGCQKQADLSANKLIGNSETVVKTTDNFTLDNVANKKVEKVTKKKDKITIYYELGSNSIVSGAVNVDDIDNIKFDNTFEIIDDKLCGWFSAKLSNGKIVYFTKAYIDKEIPVCNDSRGVRADSIKLITDKGIVKIRVDIEVSSFKLESLFDKYAYFAILNRYDEPKWTLVNSKSGKKYNFIGDIVTYLDGPYFVVVNPYGTGLGEPNCITIYSLNGDELKQEFLVKGVNWVPENLVWDDEYTIKYTQVYYGSAYKINKKVNKVIKFNGENWKLDVSAE